MDKRKNKNVLKRKGFVVTDITNNNISDCQSSNQKSTNRVNNRLKKNQFIVEDIDTDNEENKRKYHEKTEQIVSQREVKRKCFKVFEDKVKTQLNNSFEDKTNCEVIDSEDNNMSVKCEVISEQSNRISVNKSIDNLLRNRIIENKTLFSDSPLHLILGFKSKNKRYNIKQIIKDNNLIVDRSKMRKDEYIILKRNWDKYCDDYQINTEQKITLLGFFKQTNRYTKEEKKQMNQFIQLTNFYLRLAKDLPTRDLQVIVNAARRRFSPLKRFSDLTDSERDSMIKWYRIIKNKWIQIAEKLNCYPECVESHIEKLL